jgi:hypothetical protein
MNTLTEDIRTFLALHHRAASLTDPERVQYEALRVRVQAALQLPQLPPDGAAQS